MSTVTATASDAVLISPTQLLALQAAEPVVLIDTRDADTYALGHIPGTVNLRETFTYLATSTPQGLQELKDTFAAHLGAIGLSGAETAVFYEDALNSGYGQSCRGYYLLTWLGYPKVKVLNGGYSAWKASEPVQDLLSNRAKNARWTNCKLVFSNLSQFFHNRLFFSNQAKLRSTTQRWGITLNVCSSLRLAICTATCPPRMSWTPWANGRPT